MEEIYQKINEGHETYSKGFKKIAAYFYKNPKLFAISSATQVGRKIGVSETTVIRFCHRLGYKGYSDLQKKVQQDLFQKSSLSDYVGNKDISTRSIKNIMVHDIHNIQHAIEQIPETTLEMAVGKLSEADQILVSGVRSSYALANWFVFALDLVLGNTRLFQSNVDNVLLRLNELTSESVFVAFSFHRYAKDIIDSAKLAKQQNAFVIAFTDSRYAPITEFSDLILPIQLDVKSTLDAAPVVFSLMNSIVSTISLRNRDRFRERVGLLDSIEPGEFFSL